MLQFVKPAEDSETAVMLSVKYVLHCVLQATACISLNLPANTSEIFKVNVCFCAVSKVCQAI